MNEQPGAGWEVENDLLKRSWGGADDARFAAAVLGNGAKLRAVIEVFVARPGLRATRDDVVRLLADAAPGLQMGPSSVTGCRNKLGWNAYHAAGKRLNPISADKSGGPDAVWFVRPEVHAAFVPVLQEGRQGRRQR